MKRAQRRDLSTALLLAALLSWTLPVYALSEIRIGVLAHWGSDFAVQSWTPTADYLARKIPGVRFSIVPLDFDQIEPAVRRREVNLLLTNPVIAAYLEELELVSAIATLANRDISGRALNEFGGVIFIRADNPSIRSLHQLAGQRFAAVDERSLGGYLAAWAELRKAEVEAENDFSELRFFGNHDRVVEAVLAGTMDAGTVRSGTLERLSREGKLEPHRLIVLNAQQQPGFSYQLSTPLYTEWPMLWVKPLPEDLLSQITIALLDLYEGHRAVSAGGYFGWRVPGNYAKVRKLNAWYEREQAPSDILTQLRVLVDQHSFWILSALTPMLILAVALSVLLDGNRRLRHLSADLEKRRAKLEEELDDTNDDLETANQEISGLRYWMSQYHREWRDAFDAVNSLMFVHDADYRIVRANRVYLRYADLSLDDAIGRPYWEVFPKRRGPLPACVAAADDPHTPQANELELAEGEIFLCRNFAIRNRFGEHVYSVHILDDITDRRRMDQSEGERLMRYLTQTPNLIDQLDAERHRRASDLGRLPSRAEVIQQALLQTLD